MNKIVVLIFVFSNFIFANIIGSLTNRSLDISGFFFSSSKSVYFSVVNDENNFSVWRYNQDRSYKPIHNTASFDNYPKANSIFDSIKIDKDYKYLNINISKDSEYGYLSGEKLKIVHILVKSSKHNLLVNSDLSSMWEYFNGDEGRKYKPIHNTVPFDGYKGVKEIFTKLELKNNSIKIHGTKKDNYLELKQMEYDLNKIKAMKIISSKNYKDNYEKLNNNIIKDKANNLIWLNDKETITKTYEEAEKYCKSLKIGEYQNFRIPSMIELISLFDIDGKHKDIFTLKIFNKSSNSFILPPIGNTNIYWSNNIDNDSSRKNHMGLKFTLVDNKAYFIESDTARTFFASNQSPKGYTKCVESDKTLGSPMLVRNSNKQIVEDVTNNLMWQDDKYVRKDINISKANDYCKDITLGGYNDWRIPTYKESLATYYNNNTKDRVNDFYHWTRHYTLINDSLSSETQQYIIDNSQKMKKDETWKYGTSIVNLDDMPLSIRNNILDVLKFKEDKEFLQFINSNKESLSQGELKTEITSSNYEEIKKKYEKELLAHSNKSKEKEAIPTNSSPSITSIDYGFRHSFFTDYFIEEKLREELKDVSFDRVRSKENHLSNINHYKEIIEYYQNERNIENFFLSRKLMHRNLGILRSLRTSAYSDFYFSNYSDVFTRQDPFSGIILNTRKICVREDIK